VTELCIFYPSPTLPQNLSTTHSTPPTLPQNRPKGGNKKIPHHKNWRDRWVGSQDSVETDYNLLAQVFQRTLGFCQSASYYLHNDDKVKLTQTEDEGYLYSHCLTYIGTD
jgi:hypothetical protein